MGSLEYSHKSVACARYDVIKFCNPCFFATVTFMRGGWAKVLMLVVINWQVKMRILSLKKWKPSPIWLKNSGVYWLTQRWRVNVGSFLDFAQTLMERLTKRNCFVNCTQLVSHTVEIRVSYYKIPPRPCIRHWGVLETIETQQKHLKSNLV